MMGTDTLVGRITPRKIARAYGKLNYEGGKCSKNKDHGGLRYTSTGQCVKCLSEWSKNNKEKVNSRNKKYRESNPHKVKQFIKEWASKNRDKRNASLASYRASKHQAEPSWSEPEKIKVLYEKAKEYKMEVDHIVPLQSKNVCGLHCWYNLQLLDRKHNASKSNVKWPDSWKE